MSDIDATSPLMRHWSSYGKDFDALANLGDNDKSMVGIRTALTPNLRLRSQIDGHAAYSTLKYINPSYGLAKFGLNVSPSSIPSFFVSGKLPFVKGSTNPGSVAFNINKAGWRASPYFGIDFQKRWENVAVMTRFGSNPGERMDQDQKEANRVPDFEVEHAISVGDGPLSIGGHVKYVPAFGAPVLTFTDYNLGAEYKQNSYGVGVRTEDKMATVKGEVWTDTNKCLRLGATTQYDRYTGLARSGIAMRISGNPIDTDRLNIKANLDSAGNLGASVAAKIHDRVRISLGATTGSRNSLGAALCIGNV